MVQNELGAGYYYELRVRRLFSQRPGFRSTNRFFTIFGRTDLRIGVSEAKFHEEIDFDA